MATQQPAGVVEQGPFISQIDFSRFNMRVPTDRYHDRDWHARERERLWLRCWQVAGRSDEIAEAGDWKTHAIFDQSYLIVRGRDGEARAFVNACRHRGNRLCPEKSGHGARLTCPYHNWTYGLDGSLLAVARPDFEGTLEEFVGDKAELGLHRISCGEFGGFLFINPDPDAVPLEEYLGEAAQLLAPYRMEEMVAYGLNIREAINCNWKVVMDAFQEGYHIQGVHPELVPAMDESKERYSFFGDHSVATAPFGAANMADFGPDQQVDSIRGLPDVFPGVATVLPRFEELVNDYRDPQGAIRFPESIDARLLLQQATRDVLTARGLDVSGLTDTQMSDNQFFLLFPNFFATIRAGEATVIVSTPHPDGDPNRCHWHVMGLQWLPPEERAAARQPLHEVPEGEHVPYFLALEQDWEMMQRQQDGLRHAQLKEMALTRQEVRLAYFHAVLDSWVQSGKR